MRGYDVGIGFASTHPTLAEVRYVDGRPWRAGDSISGSIRLDVVEGPVANPTQIWDYKFGNAILSEARVAQIRAGIPYGQGVPVYELKP